MPKNHGEVARREQAARLLATLTVDAPKPAAAPAKKTDGAVSIATDSTGALSKAGGKKKS